MCLLAKARVWAAKAVSSERAEWKIETTHAQWLRVAYLNEPMAATSKALGEYWAAAAKVISALRKRPKKKDRVSPASPEIAPSGPEMARSARLGKVGLALSGGGFRASFYHIGVLARLAEADVLRHVDVLSTVSGGSIVGAHYYLLLRDLLQSNGKPVRSDYIGLVKNLEKQFSDGVRKNLRMRGLSNPWVTLKLLLRPGYTEVTEWRNSTTRASTRRKSFRRRSSRPNRTPRPMHSLRIKPKDEPDDFNPRFSNWRLSARVPALLINATCLNTGHSWHFTANWMGEPPELIGDVVDKNERLRRMSYRDAGSVQIAHAWIRRRRLGLCAGNLRTDTAARSLSRAAGAPRRRRGARQSGRRRADRPGMRFHSLQRRFRTDGRRKQASQRPRQRARTAP